MRVLDCILVLVPDAKCVVRFPESDPSQWTVEWLAGNTQPQPTRAAIEAAWPAVQAADAAAAQTAQAEAANETTLRSQADQALAQLRTYRDKATTTTAEDKAALKLVVRVVIALVRLVLRKLDGTA